MDMETPTVHNACAIIISAGYYLLLFLQIEQNIRLSTEMQSEERKSERQDSTIETSRKNRYVNDIKMPKSQKKNMKKECLACYRLTVCRV